MPAPKDPEKRKLWLQRLSESHKGHRHTPEQKAKIGAATKRNKTGVPRPDMRGDRHWMRNPEIAAKVGRAHRGRPKSPEQRAKIAATLRGRYKLPENYERAHYRLIAENGPASQHACLHCGKTAKDWAWRHETQGSERREYSTDLSDYIPLCRSCHTGFDSRQRRGKAK